MSEPTEPITADDLADAIVTHLHDYFYGEAAEVEPLIAFQAVNPSTVPNFEAERDDYKVFVIPDSETESPFDASDAADERLFVGVSIIGPLLPNSNVTKSIAIKFAKQLRLALRDTEFFGYGWLNSETEPLFDAAALKRNMFVSAFIAEYQGLK